MLQVQLGKYPVYYGPNSLKNTCGYNITYDYCKFIGYIEVFIIS